MQQPIDPVQAFLRWNESQDKEVQTDLAAFTVIAAGTGVPYPSPPTVLKAGSLGMQRALNSWGGSASSEPSWRSASQSSVCGLSFGLAEPR